METTQLNEEYLETHFEMVASITAIDSLDEPFGIVQYVHDCLGVGGLYMLAKSMTDSFVEKYKDANWGDGIEWFDELAEFNESILSPTKKEEEIKEIMKTLGLKI